MGTRICWILLGTIKIFGIFLPDTVRQFLSNRLSHIVLRQQSHSILHPSILIAGNKTLSATVEHVCYSPTRNQCRRVWRLNFAMWMNTLCGARYYNNNNVVQVETNERDNSHSSAVAYYDICYLTIRVMMRQGRVTLPLCGSGVFWQL